MNCSSCTISYKCPKHSGPAKDTRMFQIQCIEDAVSEIINHPLTPALDNGAQLRFKNIILRHLARMV